MAAQSFQDCPNISGLQMSLIVRDSNSQIALAVSLTGALS